MSVQDIDQTVLDTINTDFSAQIKAHGLQQVTPDTELQEIGFTSKSQMQLFPPIRAALNGKGYPANGLQATQFQNFQTVADVQNAFLRDIAAANSVAAHEISTSLAVRNSALPSSGSGPRPSGRGGGNSKSPKRKKG